MRASENGKNHLPAVDNRSPLRYNTDCEKPVRRYCRRPSTGGRLFSANENKLTEGYTMWNMIWPLLIIVGSNCLYHICAKSVPENAHAFGALTVTYLIGAALSAAVFLISVKPANALTELHKLNWASIVLGFAIVGLEAGNVFLYRAGWKISVGSLVGNISLAVVLLFVGYFLFRETVTVRQLVGVAVCAAGLFLITK